MKFMKILKKAGGILLVIIGIFFFVYALKMIFVDNPKTKAALKDAVYVDAADTIDPENDGKTVIVCFELEMRMLSKSSPSSSSCAGSVSSNVPHTITVFPSFSGSIVSAAST